MAVIEITKDNFEEEVLNSDKKVLVDFWAAWCGPCKMLSPLVDQFGEDQDEVKVGKVNVDEQPELAQQFRVVSIPTLVVMDKGQEVNRSVGLINKDKIAELVK